MTKTHFEDLQQQLEEAVAAQDFETAGKLREQIEAIRRDVRVRVVELKPQAAYFHRQSTKPSPRGR